jgi:hypothetical protein
MFFFAGAAVSPVLATSAFLHPEEIAKESRRATVTKTGRMFMNISAVELTHVKPRCCN